MSEAEMREAIREIRLRQANSKEDHLDEALEILLQTAEKFLALTNLKSNKDLTNPPKNDIL